MPNFDDVGHHQPGGCDGQQEQNHAVPQQNYAAAYPVYQHAGDDGEQEGGNYSETVCRPHPKLRLAQFENEPRLGHYAQFHAHGMAQVAQE